MFYVCTNYEGGGRKPVVSESSRVSEPRREVVLQTAKRRKHARSVKCPVCAASIRVGVHFQNVIVLDPKKYSEGPLPGRGGICISLSAPTLAPGVTKCPPLATGHTIHFPHEKLMNHLSKGMSNWLSSLNEFSRKGGANSGFCKMITLCKTGGMIVFLTPAPP